MERLQEMTWGEVRQEVSKFNSELAGLIDNLDPGDEYVLYKITCPWGQHLQKVGELYLPNNNNEWVTLDHSSIDSRIAYDLSYNITMPLGIVLENSIELYLETHDRVIPFMEMRTGTIFGLWVSLHNNKHTTNFIGKAANIIAGSKSAILLPKTTDVNSFKKIQRKFGVDCKQPTNLSEQWQLLLELAQHKEFPEQWNTTVLYFSRKWLEPDNSMAWKLFRAYLVEYAWNRTGYLRDQIVSDMAVSCALDEKNLRPNPYLSDTVKHLFSICQNVYPGYEVAIDSTTLPLNGFQKIFDEIYGLRYRPTFMVPGYLNADSFKSIYYSLDVPTLMSFSPKSRKLINKLDDLKEIKHIARRIVEYISEDELRLKGTPLHTSIHETKLDYYHTDEDVSDGIINSYELEKIDNHLILEQEKFPHKNFCDTSPFLRGCIGISMKKDK